MKSSLLWDHNPGVLLIALWQQSQRRINFASRFSAWSPIFETVSDSSQTNTEPKMGENFIQGRGDLVLLIALLFKKLFNHLKVTKSNLRCVVRCVLNKENPFVHHSSLVRGEQKPVCIFFSWMTLVISLISTKDWQAWPTSRTSCLLKWYPTPLRHSSSVALTQKWIIRRH